MNVKYINNKKCLMFDLLCRIVSMIYGTKWYGN